MKRIVNTILVSFVIVQLLTPDINFSKRIKHRCTTQQYRKLYPERCRYVPNRIFATHDKNTTITYGYTQFTGGGLTFI